MINATFSDDSLDAVRALLFSERVTQSLDEKRRKIKALQRAGHPASILIKQVRDHEDHSEFTPPPQTLY